MSSSIHTQKGILTEGSIGWHLVRLAGPMTWGIFAIISFQLVDMFYISLLGTQPLAAFSFTFPVTYGMFAFVMGFGIAMSSVLSRLIGEQRQDDLKRVTTQGLVLALAVCLALSLVGYALLDQIFIWLGADDTLRPMIREFMVPWFLGSVFISLPLVGNAAIRSTGDTVLPAAIMTVAAVVNVILDPLLIFGLLGFPRLELQGAALGTVIANALAMIAGLYIIHVKLKLTDISCLWDIKTWADTCKRLLVIAVPVGLTNTLQPIVNAIIVSLLSASGASAVAAFGIATRVEAFAFIILMGLSVGMGPIIGQNFGAQKYTRVFETLRLAMNFNILWSIGIAVILAVFAHPIASAFSQDPDVIRVTVMFFWLVPFSYIFANLFRGWASAFNALGKPQISFVMVVVELVVLMIPAVYLGSYWGGTAGVFAAIAIINVVTGSFFHLWSWKTWQKLSSAA